MSEEEAVEAATRKEERAQAKASELLPIEFPDPVNRHDTAVIWVTFFSQDDSDTVAGRASSPRTRKDSSRPRPP